MKKYQEENRESLRIYKRKWQKQKRHENPEWARLESRKSTANRKKKYGASFYPMISKQIAQWRLRNPEKIHAHRQVFVHLRNGKLKKSPCEKCGNLKVEAHHDDYSKPLDVRWLCKIHHGQADILRRKTA